LYDPQKRVWRQHPHCCRDPTFAVNATTFDGTREAPALAHCVPRLERFLADCEDVVGFPTCMYLLEQDLPHLTFAVLLAAED
jgi:hypothetical protein